MKTTLFERKGSRGWWLVESHARCWVCQMHPREDCAVPCRCSYCHDLQMVGVGTWGFWSPIDKGANSWRTLYWVRDSVIYYVRWTGFWKR